MNITVDNRLRSKFKGFQRDASDIKEITIHGTGGGTAAGIINWMCSDTCERIPLYKKAIGLFPYEIDRDGTIYEIMPVQDWYYHSEAGDYDKHTIGIELVNDKLGNAGSYTENQYESLFMLIEFLCEKYNIQRITSHDHNRAKYSRLGSKPCPGKNFIVAALQSFKDSMNFSWEIEM